MSSLPKLFDVIKRCYTLDTITGACLDDISYIAFGSGIIHDKNEALNLLSYSTIDEVKRFVQRSEISLEGGYFTDVENPVELVNKFISVIMTEYIKASMLDFKLKSLNAAWFECSSHELTQLEAYDLIKEIPSYVERVAVAIGGIYPR